ncbi:hypothetical protein ACWOAH_11170 [Vagococcus vulneris]|uniref:Uncharacterized protein n=1 Tax=Vagococcus vulneris TaxID=1977869 RepID=A0A429ZQY9_9ENTE|nr:hypothetical protein [Vagococcus vulneris]RST96144.1 hypothetical protein CBF37_11190 [Vagococcus vulneris]
MARGNKTDGFSVDNIVDTLIQENINDNVDVKDDVKDDVKENVADNDTSEKSKEAETDIVTELKENVEPEKQRVQLYIDKDVNNLLDYYGKKIGKANGGKSKFTTEILKRFLIENKLWIEKIANKK